MNSVVPVHCGWLPIPPEYLPDPPSLLRDSIQIVDGNNRFPETRFTLPVVLAGFHFSTYLVNLAWRSNRRESKGVGARRGPRDAAMHVRNVLAGFDVISDRPIH
jgi:hypothetical protein